MMSKILMLLENEFPSDDRVEKEMVNNLRCKLIFKNN